MWNEIRFPNPLTYSLPSMPHLGSWWAWKKQSFRDDSLSPGRMCTECIHLWIELRWNMSWLTLVAHAVKAGTCHLPAAAFSQGFVSWSEDANVTIRRGVWYDDSYPWQPCRKEAVNRHWVKPWRTPETDWRRTPTTEEPPSQSYPTCQH